MPLILHYIIQRCQQLFFYAQFMLCWGISISCALFMQAKKPKKQKQNWFQYIPGLKKAFQHLKSMSVCELYMLTWIGNQVKLQRRRPTSTPSVAVSTGLQGTSSLLGFYVCFTPCSPVPLLKTVL